MYLAIIILALLALLGWGCLLRTLCSYGGKRERTKERPAGTLPGPIQLNEKERAVAAIHEAGHATVAHYLGKTPTSVSLATGPSGAAFTLFPTEAGHMQTADDIRADIAILLAGRISERILRETTTSSCLHDVRNASFLARQAVLSLGMGRRTGLISYEDTPEWLSTLSERTRLAIEDDIRDLLDAGEAISTEIIHHHTAMVETLANELLEENVLEEAGLQRIFSSCQ